MQGRGEMGGNVVPRKADVQGREYAVEEKSLGEVSTVESMFCGHFKEVIVGGGEATYIGGATRGWNKGLTSLRASSF